MLRFKENIIKTEKSALNIYSLNNEMHSLLKECIKDVKDFLHVHPKIYLYGKECVQHRNIGFFADKNIKGYEYSGQIAVSQPLTENLKRLLMYVNDFFMKDQSELLFNGILINRYDDGNDYIGAHSDNEHNLSTVGVIAISYGATRKFRIRNKATKNVVADILTLPNTIIQMEGQFQKEFTHEIPIEKKVLEARYSFTFRCHNNFL